MVRDQHQILERRALGKGIDEQIAVIVVGRRIEFVRNDVVRGGDGRNIGAVGYRDMTEDVVLDRQIARTHREHDPQIVPRVAARLDQRIVPDDAAIDSLQKQP